MIDLKHLIENVSFSDKSLDLNDYLRDDNDILLGTETWYVGLYKPFKELYLEIVKFNKSTETLVMEYWNGFAWVLLPNLIDDTKNLARNGFIKWSFEDESKVTDSWKTSEINSIEKYWIRITSAESFYSDLISTTGTGNTETIWSIADEDIDKYSVGQIIYEPQDKLYQTISAIDTTVSAASITVTPGTAAVLADDTSLFDVLEVRGANIVYADDNQLVSEVRIINDYLAENDTSFIAYHVAARDEIVQTLRNGGNIKNQPQNNQDGYSFFFNVEKRIQMGKWDFLDAGEITQAAKFLCLAKIFFDVSENTEDKAYERYGDYMDMYGEAFKLFYMSLDLDDDGNTDEDEQNQPNNITMLKQ